ncbi:AAA family ATPase [Streptomyces pactum]|uniref:Helix-turn-helix transcriptional regulator n=1 Tax=Streptomyces pactum TaxID=68249 RepID=A0A1S6JHY3_9ACTN|nr:LuxR family transcriptional regulator [Streptomyces pactum]AQS71373.1 helix-turn-helix transcriptional regulator [Streptomyces pactum]
MPLAELSLLERDREQAVLSAVIGELCSARPAVVMVTGEPGLGQNDLLRWAARHAARRGVRVLTARATPAEHDLRYGVVGQLLAHDEQFASQQPSLLLQQHRPGRYPGLTRLLTTSRDHPTLLVVENVHRLDPDSQRWLEALVRRLPRVPVALVTSSTGTAGISPEWCASSPVTGMATTVELALPALTAVGTATAVETVCGTPGDPAFTAAAVDATAGNPAVLRDALCRFARAGHRPDADHVDHLRAVAAEVIGDHTAQILSELRDPVALGALRALAVCGDLLDFALVMALAGARSVPEIRLRAALEDSGLVTVRDGRPRVGGPVVRARILEEMPADERADLYARAAELAQRVAADDQGIADLLLPAGPVDAPWAVHTLRRGAAAALRAGRRDRAAAYLTRALDLPMSPEDRIRVTLRLASVELVTAPSAAERRLTGIIRASEETYDPFRTRAADLCLLGGAADGARRALATVLDEGRRSTPADPDTARADAVRRDELTALLRLAQPYRDDPLELDVPCVADLPGPPHGPAATGVRAWVAAMRGDDRPTARRLARAALDPDRAWGPPLTVPRLLACRVLLLTEDGDEAAAHLCALIAEGHRERCPTTLAHALATRADLHLRHGRPDAAAHDLAAADLELPPGSRHPLSYPYWTALALIAELCGGRADRAHAVTRRPVPVLAAEGVAWAQSLFARGLLAEAEGDPRRARALFRACGRWLLRHDCLNPALMPWRSHAAEAAHTLGDTEEALRLAREEVALAERWGAPGVLGRARLRLAGMTGEDPPRHPDAAPGTHPRAGYAPTVLAPAAAGARGHAPVPGTGRAAGRTARATTGPADLHAPDAQGQSGPRTAPADRAAGSVPPAWRVLSPAERETAVLAAGGLTNREIAVALSVTARAVELRLSGVYRKLRIRGRDELRAPIHGTEGD